MPLKVEVIGVRLPEARRRSRVAAAAVAVGAVLLATATAVALPSPAWAAESHPSDPAEAPAPHDDAVAPPLVGMDLTRMLATLEDAGGKAAAAYQAGLEAARLADEAAAAAGGVSGVDLRTVPHIDGSGWNSIELSSRGWLPVVPSSQGWVAPVPGHITDGFGLRPARPAGAQPFHAGTDIAAACGSPISAAVAGTVVSSGPYGTYGNWILVDSGDGISTGYAHIADGTLLVGVGDHVDVGQVIALVGNTGAVTGCHLHFEVRIVGTAIDAVPFMASRGAALG